MSRDPANVVNVWNRVLLLGGVRRMPIILVLVLAFFSSPGAEGSRVQAQDDTFSRPAFLPKKQGAFLGVVSMPVAGGVRITGVVPGSAAARLGLEVNDVIASVDGFPVGLEGGRTFSLPSEIRRSGQTVMLEFIDSRTGRRLTETVDVGGAALNKGDPNAIPILGVSSRIEQVGEHILSVARNSVAEAAGLQVGDHILEVDGYPLGIRQGNKFSLASEVRHARSATIFKVERGGSEFALSAAFPLGAAKITGVHIVLVGLTDDMSIGQGCAVNLQKLTDTLSALPQGLIRSSLRLTGADCTAATIFRTIQNLNVQPSESIFFYYAGHGAYDPARVAAGDISNGHFFQIPSGDVMRHRLRTELIGKGARLTVLVSDTCNVESTANPALPAPCQGATPEPPIQTLLTRFRGVIDISGSSKDEFGWTNSRTGGFFSSPFSMCLSIYPTWGQVLATSRQETMQTYTDFRNGVLNGTNSVDPMNLGYVQSQLNQTPVAFQFDVTAE